MSFSFWEQNTFIKKPDVVIIGSGIVGLNAAIALKRKSPLLHIVVLERGILPYGASTRNAGFACFGSMSELLFDLENHSEENVFSLVEKRWKGLQQLRKLIGDENLNYEPLGGFEIFRVEDELLFEKCTSVLSTFNNRVSSFTGSKENYKISDEKSSAFGFKSVNHIIENTGEGQIDTGMMMKALLKLAQAEGVEILNGANVTSFVNEGDHVNIQLTDSNLNAKWQISARRIIICINGFAKKFLPEFDVKPARAQVLITSPINNLKVKGSFHYDHGYYYFRNVGNRLLLGGGRNLDFNGETTVDMEITPVIQSHLEKLLSDMILPDSDYSIEMRWSGIMGLGDAKNPIIKKVSENIYCAVRMGGMGVAIGTLVGNEVAGMVLDSV